MSIVCHGHGHDVKIQHRWNMKGACLSSTQATTLLLLIIEGHPDSTDTNFNNTNYRYHYYSYNTKLTTTTTNVVRIIFDGIKSRNCYWPMHRSVNHSYSVLRSSLWLLKNAVIDESTTLPGHSVDQVTRVPKRQSLGSGYYKQALLAVLRQHSVSSTEPRAFGLCRRHSKGDEFVCSIISGLQWSSMLRVFICPLDQRTWRQTHPSSTYCCMPW
jgi:hypothetical protein